MRRVFLIVVCLFLSMRVGAIAQIRPEFETASIKPAAPDERATVIAMPPGGRLEIMNMTLKAMIENAYSIQPYQISGGPAWLDTDHYDISAKAGIAVKREEVLLRLQSLLADRFSVLVRREVKQLPVYALVIARKDGKLGRGLVESKKGGCVEPDPTNPFAVDPMRLCGNFALGPDGVTLVSAPIATLTPLLSRVLGRTVLDQTGLAKNFNISIEWTPDQAIAMRPPPNGGPPDSAGASIFTVFREQLGLAFQAQKGPVEMFEIERAQKPSGN
jgi:uncharacterized protein (TIGR03435 family)